MCTYFLLLLVLGVTTCVPSRYVEPIDKCEWSVGVNHGEMNKMTYQMNDCDHTETPEKMGSETYILNLLNYIRN